MREIRFSRYAKQLEAEKAEFWVYHDQLVEQLHRQRGELEARINLAVTN
ncbi:hypothetical protein LCGC14_1524510, partial [marine sediment metagenome]